MFSTESFAQYAIWGVYATLGCGLLTALAFTFSWGFRFRLVGVTSFMAVLAFGLFALSLTPITRVKVPNSMPYSLVFDDGANQTVISVSREITPEQLEATLEQASHDLFSAGRLGRENNRLFIRARTMLHPSEGLSEPLLLGEASRSLTSREESDLEVQVYEEQFSRLPPPA